MSQVVLRLRKGLPSSGAILSNWICSVAAERMWAIRKPCVRSCISSIIILNCFQRKREKQPHLELLRRAMVSHDPLEDAAEDGVHVRPALPDKLEGCRPPAQQLLSQLELTSVDSNPINRRGRTASKLTIPESSPATATRGMARKSAQSVSALGTKSDP